METDVGLGDDGAVCDCAGDSVAPGAVRRPGQRAGHPGRSRDNCIRREIRIRAGGHRDPMSRQPVRAADHAVVGVDDHHLGRGVHGRGSREPHRKVHRLAEQNHEIRCPEHVGERTERRITKPPRTFHRDHRYVERSLERRDSIAVSAPIHARTGQHQGSLRPCDSADDVIGGRTREDLRPALQLRRVHPARIDGLGIEHIERKRDVRRARPSRAGAGDGGRGVVPELLHAAGTPGGLDDGTRDVDLGHLLERSASVRPDRGIPAEQQDRALRVPCGEQCGQRVAESRPGRHQRDADLTGDLPQASAMCTAALS